MQTSWEFSCRRLSYCNNKKNPIVKPMIKVYTEKIKMKTTKRVNENLQTELYILNSGVKILVIMNIEITQVYIVYYCIINRNSVYSPNENVHCFNCVSQITVKLPSSLLSNNFSIKSKKFKIFPKNSVVIDY